LLENVLTANIEKVLETTAWQVIITYPTERLLNATYLSESERFERYALRISTGTILSIAPSALLVFANCLLQIPTVPADVQAPLKLYIAIPMSTLVTVGIGIAMTYFLLPCLIYIILPWIIGYLKRPCCDRPNAKRERVKA